MNRRVDGTTDTSSSRRRSGRGTTGRWSVVMVLAAGTASLLGLLGTGCQERTPTENGECSTRALRLATTTSVDNTGLLRALLDPFQARTGIQTHVLSVGTGQALKVAQRGDADLVLVHDRPAEERFVSEGFGVRRIPVMHNDFVLIGPATDAAKIKGASPAEGLGRIAKAGSLFVSRGDESGTHKAELRLWRTAGITPETSWYHESGQGQRLTVNMAHEKQAYCFTDRATFLHAQKAIDLQILVEGDRALHNPYTAIAVNPVRHRHVKHVEAMALIGWLTSPEGQTIIADFRRDGQHLFHPDVIPRRNP